MGHAAASAETSARRHLTVIGLLVAALLVIFRADLGSGAGLFFKAFRDINPITVWYPWSRLELLCWQDGTFPLWNPYNLFGHPLLADYQSAVFSFLLWPLVFFPQDKIALPYLIARPALAGWGVFLFCRRRRIGTGAAMVGAVAFGLTGYLIQYINDQHLVIDLLLPFLLLAIDALVEKRRPAAFVGVAGLTALVLLGGQPGAALFTLALGYAYGFFLTATAGPGRVGRLALLAAAATAGGLAAAPQLLPFLEFIPRAWTFHASWFGAERLPLGGLITLAAPGFYGPLDQAGQRLPLIRIAPYLGTVVLVLAGSVCLRPRGKRDAFFAAAFIAGLACLAGLPPFAWIVRLPGLNQLTFIKYLQPLIAVSAALLAARGADRLARREAVWPLLASALATAVGLGLAAWVHRFDGATVAGAVGLAGFMIGAAALIGLASSRAAPAAYRARAARLAPAGLLALVLLELVAAAAGNRPFLVEDDSKKDVSALAATHHEDRFARYAAAEDVALPNQGLLAPAFDLGVSDALIIKESMDLFVDIARRGRGQARLDYLKYHSLRLPLETADPELAQLAGLSHRLSREPLPPNESVAAVARMARILAPSASHFGKGRPALAGDLRSAIFAHPPCRLNMELDEIRATRARAGGYWRTAPTPLLAFAIGFEERSWSLPGDGAWFVATADTASGRLLYARRLNPSARPAERRWIEARPSSQLNRLSLSTLPGANDHHDFAWWGDLRLAERPAESPAATIAGVRIYADSASWPRAWMAKDIFFYDYPLSALDRIVSGEPTIPGKRLFAVAGREPELEGLSVEGGEVEIEEYGSGRVSIRATARAAGLLVLADAYYPGWSARVDGREQKIFRVNHAFRGVTVPAGESRVEFVYAPASFRVGLWAGLAALVSAPGFLGLAWAMRKNAGPAGRGPGL